MVTGTGRQFLQPGATRLVVIGGDMGTMLSYSRSRRL